MKVTIQQGTPEDTDSILLGNIRKVDRAEWCLGSGGWTIEALLADLWSPPPSSQPYIRSIREASTGSCHCIFGVALPDLVGLPYCWLIATDEMAKAGARITRDIWREEVSLMHQWGGPALRAVAYERNYLHVKWLLLLGFKPVAGASNGYQQEYIRHV